jgi:hypothetical protein
MPPSVTSRSPPAGDVRFLAGRVNSGADLRAVPLERLPSGCRWLITLNRGDNRFIDAAVMIASNQDRSRVLPLALSRLRASRWLHEPRARGSRFSLIAFFRTLWRL